MYPACLIRDVMLLGCLCIFYLSHQMDSDACAVPEYPTCLTRDVVLYVYPT